MSNYQGLDVYDSFFATSASVCELWQLDFKTAEENDPTYICEFALPDMNATSTTISFSPHGKYLFVGSINSTYTPTADSHMGGYVFDVHR